MTFKQRYTTVAFIFHSFVIFFLLNTLTKLQNQKLKHIKRMDNKCHLPSLVQAYSYVENGG